MLDNFCFTQIVDQIKLSNIQSPSGPPVQASWICPGCKEWQWCVCVCVCVCVCRGELFLGFNHSRAVRRKVGHLLIEVWKKKAVQENCPQVGSTVKIWLSDIWSLEHFLISLPQGHLNPREYNFDLLFEIWLDPIVFHFWKARDEVALNWERMFFFLVQGRR